MKILVDGRLISNKHTGISRYSREIVDCYIRKHGRNNVLVIVNPGLNDKEFPCIETILKPFNLYHFFRFFSFLGTVEFDVYHSLFYSGVHTKLPGKMTLLTVHDLMYKRVGNFFHSNNSINHIGVKYYDIIVKKSIESADHLVAVSDATRKDIFDLFGKESVVIKEGVNRIVDHEPVRLQYLGVEPGQFFLYVGNMRRHKNVNFLVDSFLASNTDKKLVLCGNYKKFSEIKNNRIICLGYVSDSILKTLYSNCAAFIFPSLYEGFGLPILEALANGARVFSSYGGALAEFPETVVRHFDPEDEPGLINLIENVDCLAVDNYAVHNLLEMYNWEHCAGEVISYLNKCLENRNM